MYHVVYPSNQIMLELHDVIVDWFECWLDWSMITMMQVIWCACDAMNVKSIAVSVQFGCMDLGNRKLVLQGWFYWWKVFNDWMLLAKNHFSSWLKRQLKAIMSCETVCKSLTHQLFSKNHSWLMLHLFISETWF